MHVVSDDTQYCTNRMDLNRMDVNIEVKCIAAFLNKTLSNMDITD